LAIWHCNLSVEFNKKVLQTVSLAILPTGCKLCVIVVETVKT